MVEAFRVFSGLLMGTRKRGVGFETVVSGVLRKETKKAIHQYVRRSHVRRPIHIGNSYNNTKHNNECYPSKSVGHVYILC